MMVVAAHPADAAVMQESVDTIVLETAPVAETDISVDMEWRTENDNGEWIGGLPIAQNINSLVVVVNQPEVPSEEMQSAGNKKIKKDVSGNSRLHYFSRSGEEEWQKIFSVNCFISGGSMVDSHVYGVYSPTVAFGLEENPGSLLSYRQIDSDDYWVMDKESEDYGTIVSIKSGVQDSGAYVNLESMKAFSNYGMVLQPDGLYDDQPNILINCQQSNVQSRTVSGIQLSETRVRMLIQSIDENTKIVIVEDMEDLEDL